MSFERYQQREYLDGLAQSHIVRQARSQAKLAEQIEPAHAYFLVGPQFAFQGRTGMNARQPFRTAKPLQCLRQPRTRNYLRPVRIGTAVCFIGGNIGACEHAHGLAKAEAIFLSGALHLAEVFDHPAQALTINFHPSPAHQRQPIRPGQQFLDFCDSQGLAIQRDFHTEIEQRIFA